MLYSGSRRSNHHWVVERVQKMSCIRNCPCKSSCYGEMWEKNFQKQVQMRRVMLCSDHRQQWYQYVGRGTIPSPWNLASKWPALSCQWCPMADVRTHNSRTDSRRPICASSSRVYSRRYEAKCVQRTRFRGVGAYPLRSDFKWTELPPANKLIPLERQLIALQLSLSSGSLRFWAQIFHKLVKCH